MDISLSLLEMLMLTPNCLIFVSIQTDKMKNINEMRNSSLRPTIIPEQA